MTYGRIKPGTRIMQDHAFTAWPYTTGEHHGGPPARPDTLFKFEATGSGITSAAPTATKGGA